MPPETPRGGPVAPRAAHNTALLPASIRRRTDRRIIPGPGYLPGLDDTTARKPRRAATCGRIVTIKIAGAYGTDGQPPADRGRA